MNNHKSIIGKSNRIEEEITPFEDVEARILSYKESDVMPNIESHSPIIIPNSSSIINNTYTHLLEAPTYAKGVEALKLHLQNTPSNAHPQFELPNGSNIYRPLTFKENIEARVNEYNKDNNIDGSKKTFEQKTELFNNWIDSCTAIVYEKNTTKFKIIPICEKLINIDADSNSEFLTAEYSKILGVELDFDNKLYNQDLSLQQVINHPAWLEALDNDTKLLENYAKITFNILKTKYEKELGMGFYIRQKPKTEELRALYVNDLDNDSAAVGDYYLNNVARFLLVAKSQKKFI
jgi:hypothetical protein